jgi:CheY-like chemotaxis protein
MASQRFVLCGRPVAMQAAGAGHEGWGPGVERRNSEFLSPRLDFLARLNHEIRTPLSGILGMTDLLLEMNLGPEPRSYVEATRQCAQGLAELLNSTLEYTSLSAACVELDEAEFAVAETVEAAVDETGARLAPHRVRIAKAIGPSTRRTLIGDAHRVRQVAQLLLDNAWRFSSSGQLEFHSALQAATEERADLALRVKTNGGGIGAERLAEVYATCLDIESELQSRFSYSSLGFAILRRVVELLGGELSVESHAGQGYEFAATVPLWIPRPRPVAVDAQGGQVEAGRHRILVVDDNPISRRVLSAVLGRGGFEHQAVSSGFAALEAASGARFHLVLMDVQMPEMDGIETAKRLRRLPGYARVPILALTAEVSDQVRGLCRQAGMREFLNKPVVASELLATVRRHLPAAGPGEVEGTTCERGESERVCGRMGTAPTLYDRHPSGEDFRHQARARDQEDPAAGDGHQ